MKQRERGALFSDPLFAAANSGNGFVSFYDDVFGGADIMRRYIIKGGPGTGKSTLIKKMADAAKEKGMLVEPYRCSSDPDSLDGVVIDGKIAFLDGTAPHSAEALLPGTRDEILNLGVFWNAEGLEKRRQEIEGLCQAKNMQYQRAYQYLAICDRLYALNRSMVLTAIKEEKLKRVAMRTLAGIPDGKEARIRIGLRDSIGMKGRVCFDSYERAADKLYWIEDYYDTGALFLKALIAETEKKKCAMRVSYHPIHMGEPDALFLEETGVGFVLGGEKEPPSLPNGVIRMQRFTDPTRVREIRGRLRTNRRVYDRMEEEAVTALKVAGESHWALEEIYASYMDFQAENRFFDALVLRVFRR